MGNALLVINYYDFMCENVRSSFQDAANRWDCNYVEITDDDYEINHHSGAVKLLAFELCEEDRIFIIDADAIISGICPSPFETFDESLFVAVKNDQPHFPPLYLFVNPQIMAKELDRIFTKFPRILFNTNEFFNTGVCLVNRQVHADVLARAFEVFITLRGFQWWDQAPLNYAVAESNVPLFLASSTWNYQFPDFRHWNYLERYIYHFAGLPGRYDILPIINWRVT